MHFNSSRLHDEKACERKQVHGWISWSSLHHVLSSGRWVRALKSGSWPWPRTPRRCVPMRSIAQRKWNRTLCAGENSPSSWGFCFMFWGMKEVSWESRICVSFFFFFYFFTYNSHKFQVFLFCWHCLQDPKFGYVYVFGDFNVLLPRLIPSRALSSSQSWLSWSKEAEALTSDFSDRSWFSTLVLLGSFSAFAWMSLPVTPRPVTSFFSAPVLFFVALLSAVFTLAGEQSLCLSFAFLQSFVKTYHATNEWSWMKNWKTSSIFSVCTCSSCNRFESWTLHTIPH